MMEHLYLLGRRLCSGPQRFPAPYKILINFQAKLPQASTLDKANELSEVQRKHAAGTESRPGASWEALSYLLYVPLASLSQKPQTRRPTSEDFFAPSHVSPVNSDKECIRWAAQGHLLGIS